MPVSQKSLFEVTRATVRKIHDHAKALGIDIPAVDGPSDEPQLHALQHLQSIEQGLSVHREKQGATSGTITLPDTSDSGTKSVSFPAPKGTK